MKKIHSLAAYTLARKITALVKQKYRTYDDVKPGGWMMDAKLRGKEQGAERPARLPMGEDETGLGLIAQHVQLEKSAKGYLIQVNPSAQHPATGKLLRHIAHWIENPKPQIIQDTLRALVYRIMIQEKRGGYGTRRRDGHIENKQLGGTIVYNPPQRPVWKAVARDMLPRELMRSYAPDLVRRLKALAKKFGARDG